MKAKWSHSWKNSKQARKQRKYRHNAPLSVMRKFMNIHLDKSLRDKLGKRAVTPRKGDNVKILRGSKRGVQAVISKMDIKNTRLYLEGQTAEKQAGGKYLLPFKPSNLMLTKLNLDDKRRLKRTEKPKTKPTSTTPEKKKEAKKK